MPIFFVVSEIQRSILQKLSKKYKFSYFLGHRVKTLGRFEKFCIKTCASLYPLSIGLHLMTLRQKQKVAVLFTKVSTLTPKNVQPPPLGPPSTERPQKRRILLGAQDVYPANLVSIAPRISETWITQYFPIDLNVKKNSTPPPQGPPNYLVPVPGVCSTLSQYFTPIAPSCVDTPLRYPQPYKQAKKQQT